MQVPRVARFLAWFCGLEALWLVFVGTTQSTELIAGLIASAVVAVFVDVLRTRRLLDFRLDGGTVARSRSIPWRVVFDFGLVFWILLKSLARGRRVRGSWIEVPFEAPAGARGRFARALTVALENETANAIVVDLDKGRALLHSLDTGVKTGREVM